MYSIVVNKESPIPYYHQIAERIRILISGGQLKPGDMLPTEVNLSKRLEISRLTVRHAFKELVNDGLVIRKRAKGTFVLGKRRQVPFVRDSLRSMTQQAADEGVVLRTRILAQEVAFSSPQVMRELRLASGSQVVRIRRVRSGDGVPFVVEASHFPYQRFASLLSRDLTDQSLYRILEEEYDAHPHETLDSFVSSLANAEEASLLGIDEGEPVMRCRRTGVDRDGRPVEFTQSVFRADQFRFVSRRRLATGQEE